MARNNIWPLPAAFPASFGSYSDRTGSSTPSHRSAAPNMFSTTWPATHIAWPSPTIGSWPLTTSSVSFRWRDYAHGGKKKIMTVSAHEFLRRFLLHVLPGGLVRIRHFGLFANRRRGAALERCRLLLGVTACARSTRAAQLALSSVLRHHARCRTAHPRPALLPSEA